MAVIFEPTDVEARLSQIEVLEDGEFWGGSEPYLWAVNFKIDGDTAEASIVFEGLSAELSISGSATVSSPDQGSHGNLNLPGGSISSDSVINVPTSVGRHRTTLKPIPLTITIPADSIAGEVIDTVVLSVQEFLDWLSAENGSCPPLADSPSQLLAELGAEFITDIAGGLPGAFGAVYTLMEEDFLSEESAETGRRALRDLFQEQLNETVIPDISLANQSPSDATLDNISRDIASGVEDAIFASLDLGWWLGALFVGYDADDTLGNTVALMSHLDIALGEEFDIDETLDAGGDGQWTLRGRLGEDE